MLLRPSTWSHQFKKSEHWVLQYYFKWSESLYLVFSPFHEWTLKQSVTSKKLAQQLAFLVWNIGQHQKQLSNNNYARRVMIQHLREQMVVLDATRIKNVLSLIKRTCYKKVFLFLVLSIIPFFMWLSVLLLHNNKLLSKTVATKTIVKWCIPHILRYVLLCKLLHWYSTPQTRMWSKKKCIVLCQTWLVCYITWQIFFTMLQVFETIKQ